MSESFEPKEPKPAATGQSRDESPAAGHAPAVPAEEEIGGPRGPDPTRFGDWERKGRCIDF